MSSKLSSRTGNIREFKIFQAKDGGKSIDASAVAVDIKYYEDVLSNTVSLSAIITESGESDEKKMGNKGILDGLPVRGGEPATIVLEDHDGHKLSFKNESKLKRLPNLTQLPIPSLIPYWKIENRCRL